MLTYVVLFCHRTVDSDSELTQARDRLVEGELSQRLKNISDRVDSVLGGSQQLDL